MKHISICIIALFCAIGTTQAILHPDQVGNVIGQYNILVLLSMHHIQVDI